VGRPVLAVLSAEVRVIARHRLVLVWLVLLALTFTATVVGISEGTDGAAAVAVVLIGIALLKVRLIGIHFMDLRRAPGTLRLLFEGYIVVLFMALVVLDLIAH
jgi:caa(3)-type oxidase subunit IV